MSQSATRKRRKKNTATLAKYRSMTGKTPAEVARLLGWPLEVYQAAEQGREGLSEGQMNDVRKLLRAAYDGAVIRDELRRPSKRRPQLP